MALDWQIWGAATWTEWVVMTEEKLRGRSGVEQVCLSAPYCPQREGEKQKCTFAPIPFLKGRCSVCCSCCHLCCPLPLFCAQRGAAGKLIPYWIFFPFCLHFLCRMLDWSGMGFLYYLVRTWGFCSKNIISAQIYRQAPDWNGEKHSAQQQYILERLH